ncbi:pyridoxal-phosphate dependent enzyme [Candidatus Bathyarchaeota archaeon]|nr:pyridoxal-phosphate dependent enzyme [Candidatus Bathyarchaeota archaeon]MBS7613057.1 pyridoxal-phosphate dependent enzyme [Candidatus Bathyarchaeota archaeon]MBS7617296.1 pyridoxal-phosphate dependent enzyme [Candidatus Bathyarchaeota archaeon]
MSYEVKCSKCNYQSESLIDFKCLNCGQPLSIKPLFDFKVEEVDTKRHGLWRYVKFFPYVERESIISLGEGWTPLIKFTEKTYFKLENLNPTGSFKDRGSTVLISTLRQKIREDGEYISEDSSGNAGASIAAYAARAGLKAKIYVPEGVSGPKFNQIKFYGAEVVKVSGSRDKAMEEAQKSEKGKVYVGHVLHPLFRDGLRTLAYELVEQFHWHTPERIYLPVSAGTLLLGVISGFKHLVESGIIDEMPKIVACQTRQVSPLYHAFKNIPYKPPEKITSIADALVNVNPPLLNIMVEDLRKADGDVVIVDENEVFEAFLELARKGFFVEPSSAVAYLAYKKQALNGELPKECKTVITITGSGLKTTITYHQ